MELFIGNYEFRLGCKGNMTVVNHLFCFGLGYTASLLAKTLQNQGWKISGTCRSEEKQHSLEQQGIDAYLWSGNEPNVAIAQVISNATHILHSIPPSAEGDAVLHHFGNAIKASPSLTWFGYLSTTGVYGDHQGRWVDETIPVNPPNDRSRYRAKAEQDWLALGISAYIFRLSGIYGAGRSSFEALKSGTARRIDKPGQIFSRIHVEDIVQVLHASINKPNPGSIYNVADDEPAPQADVVAYAATLLSVEPPPLVPFEQADLSLMARSFYASNRRVSNQKIKNELEVKLKYPSYREGLSQIASETGF